MDDPTEESGFTEGGAAEVSEAAWRPSWCRRHHGSAGGVRPQLL